MSQPTVYDAVVVGAGPAGASAAHVLGLGGARVLLLEKARLPRYKPCGGGITARARAASPLANTFQPETVAGALQLHADRGPITCSLPNAIGMTMRERFDAHLVEQAAAAGVEVRDSTPLTALELGGSDVRMQAGTQTLRARYVVGADGANGVTARLAGFVAEHEPATAIEAEVRVRDRSRARFEHAALLDFTAVRGGYAWIFGKEDHLSAGVYTIDARARRDLRPALSTFLSRHPDLREGTVLLQRGHRVPLAGGRRTRRRGPVLLAGDAAALADPLTGEGISYALASGRRAGAGILAALAGDMEGVWRYDHYLQRDLCGDLRYARLVAIIAYRFPTFGLKLTEEHAGMRTLIAAAVSGTLDYQSLAARLLRSAPRLLRYAK